MAKRNDSVLLVAVLVVTAGIAATVIGPSQQRKLARLEARNTSAAMAPGGVLTLSEIGRVEEMVVRAAVDTGVGITGLEADRSSGGAVLVEYGLRINAVGRYHDLGAFVANLETLPWMSRLSGLRIERRVDGTGTMRLRLSVPMAVGTS